MKGVTYSCIMEMDQSDRVWLLKRLHKQLKNEQEAMKKKRK